MVTIDETPRTFCLADDTASGELCAVSFEARTFDSLKENVTRWLAERPGMEIVSLSHATETNLERRYDRISFGTTEPANRYSAILIARPEAA